MTAVEQTGKGGTALAQELPAPQNHSKVVFENDQVRALRYRYEPGDKSTMHHHPDNVQIFLTDAHARYTFPDGKTGESTAKTGDVRWRPALDHAVENIGDKPFEGILVEMKGPAAAKTATAK